MKNLPIIADNLNPVSLFVEGGIDEILARVEKEVMSVVPDMDTAQGRKEIASLAHMVAKSKVALDNLGKDFVAGRKEELKKVDEQRKISRDFLDALKEKVRQPLTDFEEAEKAQVAAELLAQEIEECHAEALEINDFMNRKAEIERKEAELAKREEERKSAERAEQQKKEQAEREERIRKEAAEQAKRDAELALQAEKEKVAKAERDAKEAAERAERDKQAAVEDEQRKAREESERKDRERIEAEMRERISKEQEAEKARKKADNAKHREKVKSESVRFIKGIYGTTQEQADGIFDAIATGAVPRITVQF